MVYETYKTKDQKQNEKNKKWHLWYAWRPITTICNKRVWGQQVERRKLLPTIDIYDFEYRLTTQ